MRSAGLARRGRLLLLDFIEKREVAARHVLDLLAKRPDVLERTVGRLEPGTDAAGMASASAMNDCSIIANDCPTVVAIGSTRS